MLKVSVSDKTIVHPACKHKLFINILHNITAPPPSKPTKLSASGIFTSLSHFPLSGIVETQRGKVSILAGYMSGAKLAFSIDFSRSLWFWKLVAEDEVNIVVSAQTVAD